MSCIQADCHRSGTGPIFIPNAASTYLGFLFVSQAFFSQLFFTNHLLQPPAERGLRDIWRGHWCFWLLSPFVYFSLSILFTLSLLIFNLLWALYTPKRRTGIEIGGESDARVGWVIERGRGIGSSVIRSSRRLSTTLSPRSVSGTESPAISAIFSAAGEAYETEQTETRTSFSHCHLRDAERDPGWGVKDVLLDLWRFTGVLFRHDLSSIFIPVKGKNGSYLP